MSQASNHEALSSNPSTAKKKTKTLLLFLKLNSEEYLAETKWRGKKSEAQHPSSPWLWASIFST
jgi:hypothetical protein